MKVTYKRGNTIVYTKGMSLKQVIEFIERRMEKRAEELKKREWIVKEYRSLEAKQAEDRQWLSWLNEQNPETWNENS